MEEKPEYDNGVAYIDKDGALRIRINKKLAQMSNINNKDKLRIAYYTLEKKMVIKRLEDLF